MSFQKMYSKETWSEIFCYQKLDFPIRNKKDFLNLPKSMHPKKAELRQILEIIEKSIKSDDCLDGHWQYPSLYDAYKVVKYHNLMCDFYPQYANIDGVKNVWIVKPCYNSRGFGIYCTDDII